MADSHSQLDVHSSRRSVLKATGLTGTVGLAGCLGVLGDGNDGDVTLQIRHMDAPGLEDQLDKHTADFEDETGIAVEYELMGWGEASEQQMASITSQSGPDVEEIASSWIPQQVEAGGWMDMQEIDGYQELDPFFDPVQDVAMYDGKQIGVPWYWGPRGHLQYDPLLENAGLDGSPSTWDELADMNEQFQSEYPDKNLFGLTGVVPDLGHHFATLTWQNGGQLLSDDNSEVTFNSDAAVEGMNYWASLISEHDAIPSSSAEWGPNEINSAFINERIGSLWGSLTAVERFEEERDDVSREDFSIHELPAGPNGDSATFFGLELVGIHPWTDHPTEAAKWVSYLSKQQVNGELSKSVGFLPTREDSFELDIYEGHLYDSFQEEILPTGKTFPAVLGWGQVEESINNAVGEILTSVATDNWDESVTREELDDAAQQAQNALDNQ
ncbi:MULTISPECIES: ABC transporter substrate-binding protein [Halostella]|uniref:ABC transporter substrate-binding protein n=1 Tax=Halostella TaxID=1843185 RepID=UPI00107FF070|nr:MULTISPECIES: extracellular solute-binding protein [Halostella]